jgi:probable O-glycosylation ligase (exosortase A-associated)
MRDSLLLVIVIAISAVALFRPRIGVLGYVWYALMRPDVLAWVGDERQYSAVIAAATLIGTIPTVWRAAFLFRNPVILGLLTLSAAFTASGFTALDPTLSDWPLREFWKMMIVLLLVPLWIQTREHFRWLFLLIGVSLGIHGLRFGAYGLVNGGVRFGGGYGGSFDGNNELAMALVMALPFCWYATQLSETKKFRLMFAAMVIGCIAATVMTFSRAAAIGLAVVLLLLLKNAKRKVVIGLAMMAVVGPAVYMVRDEYFQRLGTMSAPTEEASANARLTYWSVAGKMWQDHPVLGVGFGQQNEQAILDSYVGYDTHQVMHNTFLQVLVDTGAIGFFVFLSLLLGTIAGLAKSASHASKRNDPAGRMYAAGIAISLVGFAICGFFGSRERYDFLYILLVTAAAWYEVRRTERLESAEAPEHLAAAGSDAPLVGDGICQAT